MKKQFFLPVAAILLCTASVTGQTTLSLDQCLSIALNDNPTVKIADLEIKRADYSRKETLGQLLPSVNFGFNYNRMLAKQVAYMNMDGFGSLGGNDSENPDEIQSKSSKKDNGIKMGLDNSYSTGFSASLPLIAPQLWKSLKLSDAQILMSVEQARSSKLDLVNQVKSAYYALLLAKDSQKVIKESYDMAALTHDIYTKQYAAGAASDYDVLRTSVAMKNIEPELMQAEIAVKQARLQLAILMGVDATFDFTPSSTLSDYETDMYEQTLAIDADYSANPSLALNKIETDIANKTVGLRRAAYYPTVALTANYNWTSSSDGNPFKNFRWTPYSVVGFTVSFPLFEGGQRYNAVRQAKVQAQEMALQRENLERSVANQVSLAIDNIKINVKQIASCSESVGQADRAHSIMEKSFSIGSASYLDLRDSELALTQARLAYNQAIYNYLIANSELELLLGNAPIDKYTSSENN